MFINNVLYFLGTFLAVVILIILIQYHRNYRKFQKAKIIPIFFIGVVVSLLLALFEDLFGTPGLKAAVTGSAVALITTKELLSTPDAAMDFVGEILSDVRPDVKKDIRNELRNLPRESDEEKDDGDKANDSSQQ